MKRVLISSLIAIAIFYSSSSKAQNCIGNYTISYTASETKKAKKIVAKVSFMTGWQIWVITNQATYKTPANVAYIFGLIDFPDRQVLVKLFKGKGANLVGSQLSPSVNCEDIITTYIFDGVDNKGTKVTLTKASF